MSAPGQVFYDGATKRWMKYVPPDSTHWTAGWILYRHADGGWVTRRKASEDDVAAISRAALVEGLFQ